MEHASTGRQLLVRRKLVVVNDHPLIVVCTTVEIREELTPRLSVRGESVRHHAANTLHKHRHIEAEQKPQNSTIALLSHDSLPLNRNSPSNTLFSGCTYFQRSLFPLPIVVSMAT